MQHDLRMYAFALGVIILSAVLKRRMTLADKAKSLFISKWGSNFISRFDTSDKFTHVILTVASPTNCAHPCMVSWQLRNY